MKTAHELAKELLAGPNLPIFHFDASKAGTDDEIDTSISEPKIEKVDEPLNDYNNDEPYAEAFLTICDSHDYPEALTESESALRADNAALKAKCEEAPYAKLREIEEQLYAAERDLGIANKNLEGEKVIRGRHVATLTACREELRVANVLKTKHLHDCVLAQQDTERERGNFHREELAHDKTVANLATLTERNAALEKALTETCGFMEESSLIGICTLTKSIRAVLAKNKEGK